MLRGNRLLITALAIAAAVAILIGWFTWPTSPSLTNYGEANPRNSQYRPGGHQCEPTVLAAIRDSGERVRQADACAKEAEEYRQQTNDLIQQTRAADAAKAQANIASQQLWPVWFQTIGGFLTLCAAVGAAVYARGAEQAARESLDHSRDIAKMEYGPQIVADSHGFGGVIHFESHDMWLTIKNVGKTIAFQVSTATHLKIQIGEREFGAVLDSDFKLRDIGPEETHSGAAYIPRFEEIITCLDEMTNGGVFRFDHWMDPARVQERVGIGALDRPQVDCRVNIEITISVLYSDRFGDTYVSEIKGFGVATLSYGSFRREDIGSLRFAINRDEMKRTSRLRKQASLIAA